MPSPATRRCAASVTTSPRSGRGVKNAPLARILTQLRGAAESARRGQSPAAPVLLLERTSQTHLLVPLRSTGARQLAPRKPLR